jgi:hypothetical protein
MRLPGDLPPRRFWYLYEYDYAIMCKTVRPSCYRDLFAWECMISFTFSVLDVFLFKFSLGASACGILAARRSVPVCNVEHLVKQ